MNILETQILTFVIVIEIESFLSAGPCETTALV